jgi:hypothetical protein
MFDNKYVLPVDETTGELAVKGKEQLDDLKG